MCYVIQNFSFQKFTLTPRILAILFFKNLNLLLFILPPTIGLFFKTQSHLFGFLDFIFFKKLKAFKSFFTITSPLLSTIRSNNNKQQRSLVYLLLKSFNTLPDVYFYKIYKNYFCDKYLYNLYFLSRKIINTNPGITSYQMFFFFFMIIYHSHWFVFSSRFNLVFPILTVNRLFEINVFYNGFFFNIFNY